MSTLVEFNLSPEEMRDLVKLYKRFPNGSFRVKRVTRHLTDTAAYRQLYVRIYGYDGQDYRWSNGGKWASIPNEIFDGINDDNH